MSATSIDLITFDQYVSARTGEHDAYMILEQLRLKREKSNNTYFLRVQS